MRKTRAEPREADRHSPAERLTGFDMPRTRRPHHIRLPGRGPAQQMRSVIADYHAAAIVGEHTQIDTIAHKFPIPIVRTILFTK